MKEIGTISIIGTGNVAFHLGRAFHQEGVRVIDVYGRSKDSARQLANQLNANFVDRIEDLNGELILLCVNDDAIASVLKEIPAEKMVAYTSGAVSLKSLPFHENCGVFYPLQTFSKDRDLLLFEVPFLIEAQTSDFAQQLFDLAWKISKNVAFATSEERLHYHISAVFANNFTNHLFQLSKDHVQSHELNWEFLHPLIRETIAKMIELGPEHSQTGPAVRGDLKTLDMHLSHLNGTSKEVYDLLSKSIIKRNLSDDQL